MELPVQVTPLLVKLGVMVNVTVIAALVALVSEPLIVPLPLAAIPVTPRLLRVQLNTVPPTELPSKIEVMAEPLQIVWLTGLTNTSGMGFTTTVAVMGVPGQLFADGVIVKVTVIGAAVKFVSEPLILPLPLAAIPVTPRLSRVQLNIVPPTLPLFTMVVMADPLQIVCDEGVATALGVGFTVMFPVAVPVPLPPVNVTV